MSNKVAWFEIIGGDGPKQRHFYNQLFGWSFQEAAGMDYGMVNGESTGLGGGIGTDLNGHSYVTIYVHVADINAALAKAEELGGKTIVPKTVIPNMVTFALFSDPAGHPIGLLEG
jgi:predicted enzyme related to lactoylglutathione lyase